MSAVASIITNIIEKCNRFVGKVSELLIKIYKKRKERLCEIGI